MKILPDTYFKMFPYYVVKSTHTKCLALHNWQNACRTCVILYINVISRKHGAAPQLINWKLSGSILFLFCLCQWCLLSKFPSSFVLVFIQRHTISLMLSNCPLCVFVWTDLLPTSGGEEMTKEFLQELLNILLGYIYKSSQRSAKVISRLYQQYKPVIYCRIVVFEFCLNSVNSVRIKFESNLYNLSWWFIINP